jgi:hypothetical protein
MMSGSPSSAIARHTAIVSATAASIFCSGRQVPNLAHHLAAWRRAGSDYRGHTRPRWRRPRRVVRRWVVTEALGPLPVLTPQRRPQHDGRRGAGRASVGTGD